LINDRTHGLSSAAQASADSALRLETALSNALDILAKATHLTDAARQSADAATVAANSTAGAVRDSTMRAIDDAKRAADLIRNEAVNVEREAAIALERLQEAAEQARTAAIGAREAAEQAPAAPATPRQPVRNRAQPLPREQEDAYYDASWREDADPLAAAPPPARNRRDDAAMFGEREEPVRDYQRRDDDRAPPPSDWTWRDLLSNVDNQDEPARRGRAPARREPPEDAVANLRRQISEPRSASALPIASLFEQAGLNLAEAFSPSGLERIAQRARAGTQARRRAVQDAAPDATRRLADFLARNAGANQEAMQFLRSEGARTAELLARGRAAMGAEATRAFLLIDAAAG
jgi:hypothetical protein